MKNQLFTLSLYTAHGKKIIRHITRKAAESIIAVLGDCDADVTPYSVIREAA